MKNQRGTSDAIKNALVSLEGLSVGDAFGEKFFGAGGAERTQRRELPAGPWRWTDDTQMAISIVAVLHKHGQIKQDELAKQFATRFQRDPRRGYGSGAKRLLSRLAQGEDWRELAPALFSGGSYGNGGAMRAAPIGAYFAGDPQEAAHQGQLATEITHAHIEGQAGAMAVAAASALASGEHYPVGREFLQAVLRYVPEGETLAGIESACLIEADELELAVARLGTGQLVSAQDTVPFCLWCAAHHLDDYQEALWKTVAGLGDRDTTCAIVGGITAIPSGGAPGEWVRRREPLPEGFEPEE